jgi:hypothetical protein
MTTKSLSLRDNLHDLIRLRKRFRLRTARPLEECAVLIQDMNQSSGCFRDAIRAKVIENPENECCNFKISISGGKGMTSVQAIGTILKVNNNVSQLEGYIRPGYDLLIFNIVSLIVILGVAFALPDKFMGDPGSALFIAAIVIFNCWYPVHDFRRLYKIIWIKLFEPASLIQ